MFLGYYNLANFTTLIGMMSSVTAMFAAYQHNFKIAAILLLFSGVCDAIDGKLARNHVEEPEPRVKYYGMLMDSLCDLVSFGVAPAFIAYCFGNRTTLDIVIFILFIACGVIRLAYYSTRAITTDGKAKGFIGVPITASAAFIPPILTVAMFVEPAVTSVLFRVFFAVMGIAYILKIRTKRPSAKLLIFVIVISALCISIMLGMGDIDVRFIA